MRHCHSFLPHQPQRKFQLFGSWFYCGEKFLFKVYSSPNLHSGSLSLGGWVTRDLQGIEFSFVGAARQRTLLHPVPLSHDGSPSTIPAVPSSPFPSKSSLCILCPSPKCVADTFVSRNRKSGEHSLILAHTKMNSFSDSLFHILGKLREEQTGMALSAGWRETKLMEMCGKVSGSVCGT